MLFASRVESSAGSHFILKSTLVGVVDTVKTEFFDATTHKNFEFFNILVHLWLFSNCFPCHKLRNFTIPYAVVPIKKQKTTLLHDHVKE